MTKTPKTSLFFIFDHILDYDNFPFYKFQIVVPIMAYLKEKFYEKLLWTKAKFQVLKSKYSVVINTKIENTISEKHLTKNQSYFFIWDVFVLMWELFFKWRDLAFGRHGNGMVLGVGSIPEEFLSDNKTGFTRSKLFKYINKRDQLTSFQETTTVNININSKNYS